MIIGLLLVLFLLFIFDELVLDIHIFGGLLAFFLLGVCLVSGLITFSHADDLGIVRAQSEVIKAYEKTLQDLNKQFNFTEFEKVKPSAKFYANHDAPSQEIIKQIADLNGKIGEARAKLAQAKVSIESRKAGPFWFVVSIYGDR